MTTHDLRRKAQRLTDLRTRYNSHEKLSDDEMEELRKGIPDDEMHDIVMAIRAERRSAEPSKKSKEKAVKIEKEQIASTPIDINKFVE